MQFMNYLIEGDETSRDSAALAIRARFSVPVSGDLA
jgi:hypothetical protein